MKGSFARDVAVAAALLVGFYVFAGIVAAALLALAIVPWLADLPQNLWVSIACLVSGLAIVRGIIPRRAPFEAPGPRLERADQPELHAIVDEVADTTEQERPAEVYLAPDVNASVTETGGLMGFGGRRVMVVGLPLMDCLTVGQLRAVVAHEFGHYHGGDTKLGPWFFRTYDAIARTVGHLQQAGSIWERPFTWYGMFFLRRSSAIKRRQEFLADELAARAGGKRAAIEGLHAVHASAPAFDGYWQSEVAPVLSGGHRAPLLEGFRRFQSAGGVKQAVEDGLAKELEGRETDPYDTHPSLRERVDALERLPDDGRAVAEGDERPAISLLRDPEGIEDDLLVALFGPEVAELEPVRWEDVPERALLPNWREFMEPHRQALAGITAGGIPDVTTQLTDFGRRLTPPEGVPEEALPLPAEFAREYGASVLDTGLALALRESGWTIYAPPGEPVAFARGEERVEPFGVSEALASGELSREDWTARCARAGIAGLQLSGEPAPPPEPPVAVDGG